MYKGFTVAVLADIHGNYLALQACIEYARSRHIEHYLFLGDYITDHAYPDRVMKLLYYMRDRYKCRFIRGNREDYMISYRKKPEGWTDSPAQGALLSCYERLKPEDISFFESLPISGNWQIDNAPAISYCHGSPEATRSDMRGDQKSLELLNRQPTDLLAKGHNHRRWALSYKGKRLICAGSVGVPVWGRAIPGGCSTTRGKLAQMLLLHLQNGRWMPEWLEIPYDWRGAIENIRTSGLKERAPIWADMLRYNVLTGLDPFGVLPKYAADLYRHETNIDVGWPQVPLEYWIRAAKVFGVELEW